MRDQLNGVIVLDKPAGMSSARAVAEVKKIMGAAKVGHTGTLDPFATGVLLCCINQATRLARFFLHGDKHYEAVLRLGIETDTLDATGQVVARHAVPDISEKRLRAVFDRFKGRQLQQPPVYAALKHEGTPLYKLARQGKPVQKPARPIDITTLCIQDVALPDVRFEMSCSAGTYVRVLCADIGRAIGCGGHLAALRRTAGSGFSIDEAATLDGLKAMPAPSRLNRIVPMAAALRDMPALEADAALLQRLANGRPLEAGHVPEEAIAGNNGPLQPGQFFKAVDRHGNLTAVLQKADDGTTYNYCCVFR